MNEAQEKALWDFVKACAKKSEEDDSEVGAKARALLSVLAEEVPPVKEPRCDCGWDGVVPGAHVKSVRCSPKCICPWIAGVVYRSPDCRAEKHAGDVLPASQA